MAQIILSDSQINYTITGWHRENIYRNTSRNEFNKGILASDWQPYFNRLHCRWWSSISLFLFCFCFHIFLYFIFIHKIARPNMAKFHATKKLWILLNLTDVLWIYSFCDDALKSTVMRKPFDIHNCNEFTRWYTCLYVYGYNNSNGCYMIYTSIQPTILI